ncbi:MAG: metal-dependent transcriptional regulator [Lachnospiraceae bacterium]|nr:metal-dependent transcriptional regulator [Lachnospiraceae bacterium]
MNESAEDYIKTLYILKRRIGAVRSVDVAREMGFSRASVSTAMTNLRKKGIIVMEKNGSIDFTEKGAEVAEGIFEKYSTLIGFLQVVAGVDEETAREDACKMEHGLSESTYSGIRRYVRSHAQAEPHPV